MEDAAFKAQAWLCVFLLCLHLTAHELTLASFAETFSQSEPCLMGASPISLVIRPTGADMWVSTAVAVAGVFTPGMVRQCVWGKAAARELGAADGTSVGRLRRSLQSLFSVLARGSEVNLHSQYAAGSHPTRESGGGRNVQDGSPCRLARLVAVGQHGTFGRRNDGCSRCRRLSHHEVWRRVHKSLLPRRRNPPVSVVQVTISRRALRVSDECARGPRTTSNPFSTTDRHISCKAHACC